MTITVQWDDDERRVIRYDFSDRWTVEEFNRAFRCSREMTEEVGYHPHIIVDFTRTLLHPAQMMMKFRQADYGETFRHHQGMQLIVGADPYFRTLVQWYMRLFLPDLQAHFVDTLDEARQLIHQKP